MKLDDFLIPGVNHPKQRTVDRGGEEEFAGIMQWVNTTISVICDGGKKKITNFRQIIVLAF